MHFHSYILGKGRFSNPLGAVIPIMRYIHGSILLNYKFRLVFYFLVFPCLATLCRSIKLPLWLYLPLVWSLYTKRFRYRLCSPNKSIKHFHCPCSHFSGIIVLVRIISIFNPFICENVFLLLGLPCRWLVLVVW